MALAKNKRVPLAQFAWIVYLPGHRLSRNPGLHALPEDVFRKVGRQTSDHRLQSLKVRRLSSIIFRLGLWFVDGRHRRDQIRHRALEIGLRSEFETVSSVDHKIVEVSFRIPVGIHCDEHKVTYQAQQSYGRGPFADFYFCNSEFYCLFFSSAS
jgi:hypothetical protein